jgi:hypothetical protein
VDSLIGPGQLVRALGMIVELKEENLRTLIPVE